MGACQSRSAVPVSSLVVHDVETLKGAAPRPSSTQPTTSEENDSVGVVGVVGAKQQGVATPSAATAAASAAAAAEEMAQDKKDADATMSERSIDTVGLKEMTEAMKADGKLNETYVRMETPIGIPIEDVYDGVHNGLVLGSGVSGVVRLVRHKATGIEYASKSIDLGLIGSVEALTQLRDEISIMCQVDHPNIVRLEEVYESEHEIYLVQELCLGGDLFDRLDGMPDYHYTENQCARLVKQMLSSLIYLHSKKIIHRDLKLENFLFSSRKADSELKLIDFGLSKHFQYGEVHHESVGTPYTVAPEVIKGSYDERSDLWAVGVIIYLLLSGETPFGGCDGENLVQVRDNILRGSFAFEPADIWENVSDLAKGLIRSLLVVDHNERPSAKEVLRHAWIERVNGYDSGSESNHGNGLNPNVVKALVSFKEYSDMRKLLLEILSFTLLPDQIMGLRGDFEKLDVDGDGEISLEELKQMLVENAEAGCLGALTDLEVEQIFDAMRVQKTETSIRWHEFIAAGLSQCKVDERNLRLAFNRLDADRKGYITFENFVDLIGSNGDRDELQMMWHSSIKSECRSDAERIYYDDFVLLMKGQTKEDAIQSQKILSSKVAAVSDEKLYDKIREDLNAKESEESVTTERRSRSLDHTSKLMDSDDEEENPCPKAAMFGANSTRAVVLPGRRGSSRKVDRVIQDRRLSPLVVNKTLYRANREMRLAVLEASKRFDENQAQHSKIGLVMRRGSCRSCPTEQELLATAKKRSGRTRRYRTCSDLTGMVMVPAS